MTRTGNGALDALVAVLQALVAVFNRRANGLTGREIDCDLHDVLASFREQRRVVEELFVRHVRNEDLTELQLEVQAERFVMSYTKALLAVEDLLGRRREEQRLQSERLLNATGLGGMVN